MDITDPQKLEWILDGLLTQTFPEYEDLRGAPPRGLILYEMGQSITQRLSTDIPSMRVELQVVTTPIRRRRYGPGGTRRLQWLPPAKGTVWMMPQIDWSRVRAPAEVHISGERPHQVRDLPVGSCSRAYLMFAPPADIYVRLLSGQQVTAEGRRIDLIVRRR